jgi:hypothetical protein
MSPAEGGGDGLLERLLRTNEDQARAAGAIAELQRVYAENQRETIDELRRLREQSQLQGIQTGLQTEAMQSIVKSLHVMDDARGAAIEALKDHVGVSIEAGFKSSQEWWRRMAWIAIVAIAASNVVGASIDWVVSHLPH